jgi:hypothetical protein
MKRKLDCKIYNDCNYRHCKNCKEYEKGLPGTDTKTPKNLKLWVVAYYPKQS